MNPYAEPIEAPIQTMNDLFGNLRMAPAKKGQSERGELLRSFSLRTGKPIGYLAMRLAGFHLPDLYYLQSICADSERRGGIWAKTFWGSIKAPHDDGRTVGEAARI